MTGLVGLLGSDAPRPSTPRPRGALIEGIIEESEDEGLMDRYLGGEPVTEDALLEDLHRAMARGTFFPVVAGLLDQRRGLRRAARPDGARLPGAQRAPSPETFTPAGAAADPVTCDPHGPLVAEVVKTTSDPYVGRVSLVRVFSGTLDPDRPVHVSGHLTSFFGAESRPRRPRRRRAGRLRSSYPFGQQLQPGEAGGRAATSPPSAG